MQLKRVTEKFEIEMSGSTKRYVMSVKQGDRATRYAEATLLFCGEKYEIPTGANVTAYIRKPDRKRVYTPCEFSGAVVTVELNSQALAAAGTALCEIEAKSADLTQVITSASFEIEIEERVKDEDAIASADEMSILDTTLKQYADAEQKRVNAESARQQAETARKQEETERQQAETARQQAETARQQAETARKQAETARQQAEAGRVSAENERKKSTQAALDNANKAVEVANQVNEASYILDADANVKYAYAIYAKRGVPHMALTQIKE